MVHRTWLVAVRLLGYSVVVATSCSPQMRGEFGGAGGVEFVGVSLPGTETNDAVSALVEAVDRVGREGATISVQLATATAHGSTQVAFGAASNGGRLWPTGRNPAAWKQSVSELSKSRVKRHRGRDGTAPGTRRRSNRRC